MLPHLPQASAVLACVILAAILLAPNAASAQDGLSYTVVEGHEDTNGISINANKLTHNGATIVDAADSTKNAVLTHGVAPADPDHKVDGVRPVFQSATIFPADPDRIVRGCRRSSAAPIRPPT